MDLNSITVYVDGSYNDAIKKYAFGCVFILDDGEIYLAFGNGDNPESLKQRNVTGEMLGAMYAVQCARKSGYRAIDIYYDYSGIESWVSGAWKAKNELTQKYRDAMRGWGTDIKITFHKVEGHSGDKYNDLADKTAKRGLTEGEGIPAVKAVTDLEFLDL
ncbi:MAG: reverse transcriptase-like protein [Lachnospiraceae bacterium]|nr:reverse transcriptase-like protein [Lachnospiraceae bacterium]